MLKSFWERLHKLERHHQLAVLIISSLALALFGTAADRLFAKVLHLEESALMACLGIATGCMIMVWLHRAMA